MTFDQTHWAPRRQARTLPTFYYHTHFVEMLEFVMRHYAHALLEEHVRFADEFRALPRPAQCLYVRLVNRKGRVFARDRIRYPELGSTAPLIAALERAGWVGPPDAKHFEDVLGFLTRAEIYDVVLASVAGVARSMKKAELIAFVREHMKGSNFMAAPR